MQKFFPHHNLRLSGVCMKQKSFTSQLQNNAVALISLVVAILAVVLNTWRLEQTEKNRNVRQAGFEILKNLGELQAVVNANHYQLTSSKMDPLQGWTYIAMMGDMVVLMPPPVPDNLNQLIQVWSTHWKNLSDDASVDQVSTQIDKTREGVMQALNHLR